MTTSLVRRTLHAIEWRRRMLGDRLRGLRVEPVAWVGDRVHRARYVHLNEDQIKSRLTSKTCVILGSGQSLDDLSDTEWRAIAETHTIAFNYFSRAHFVRVDFHLVGEIVCDDIVRDSSWRPAVNEYARLIETNPFYVKTVLGLQEGLRAFQSNRLVASGGLRESREVFRYRRIARGLIHPPTATLREGLVHGAGTLVACINLAVVLGFRHIILAGVDLYDRRTFSHSGDLAAGDAPTEASLAQPHLTAHAMVDYMRRWAPMVNALGIDLTVYNPRSLLAGVLPVTPRLA